MDSRKYPLMGYCRNSFRRSVLHVQQLAHA
jgi:hypothetical protein